jgi:adenosylhomocysteinase
MASDTCTSEGDLIQCVFLPAQGTFQCHERQRHHLHSGHFNVELNIPDLESLAVKINKVRTYVDEYTLEDGRRINLLAEGRLINLSAAEGHPASVMDMSFAVQALTTEYAVKNKGKLKPKVYDVPRNIDAWVARLKLKSMGIEIDTLTPEQKKYLSSWEMGT